MMRRAYGTGGKIIVRDQRRAIHYMFNETFYMQILGFPSGRHTLPSAKNRDKHMTTSPNPAHTEAGSLALEYQGFSGDANRR